MNLDPKRAKSMMRFFQTLENLKIADDDFLFYIIKAAIKEGRNVNEI